METLKPALLTKALLLCSLVQIPTVLAHLPELYGREYIRLEESPEHPVHEPERAASELSLPSKEDQIAHDQQLKDAEIANGPYAAGLTDPLINLGHYHQQRGDLDDSIEAYRRALHLIRINDGFASSLQIPILRAMAEIYQSTGDHQPLGDLYQYYYRLRKLGEPPTTPEQLAASLEYIAWERELYAARSDGNEKGHLLRAYRANEELLESSTPVTDQELEWYISLVMSQMRNLYLILGDDPMSMEASKSLMGQGVSADRDNRKLAYIQKVAPGKGKNLLVECIKLAQSLSAVDLAAVYLELGDWYQWNGKLGSANKQYVRVVELLHSAGEEQLLGRWLDQPVELPDEPDLWHENSGLPGPGQFVVEARYDVNSKGDAKKVEVTVTDEEGIRQAWRIKRMLRDTHFRPRFSQGQPESYEQLSRRYVLIEAH